MRRYLLLGPHDGVVGIYCHGSLLRGEGMLLFRKTRSPLRYISKQMVHTTEFSPNPPPPPRDQSRVRNEVVAENQCPRRRTRELNNETQSSRHQSCAKCPKDREGGRQRRREHQEKRGTRHQNVLLTRGSSRYREDVVVVGPSRAVVFSIENQSEILITQKSSSSTTVTIENNEVLYLYSIVCDQRYFNSSPSWHQWFFSIADRFCKKQLHTTATGSVIVVIDILLQTAAPCASSGGIT